MKILKKVITETMDPLGLNTQREDVMGDMRRQIYGSNNPYGQLRNPDGTAKPSVCEMYLKPIFKFVKDDVSGEIVALKKPLHELYGYEYIWGPAVRDPITGRDRASYSDSIPQYQTTTTDNSQIEARLKLGVGPFRGIIGAGQNTVDRSNTARSHGYLVGGAELNAAQNFQIKNLKAVVAEAVGYDNKKGFYAGLDFGLGKDNIGQFAIGANVNNRDKVTRFGEQVKYFIPSRKDDLAIIDSMLKQNGVENRLIQYSPKKYTNNCEGAGKDVVLTPSYKKDSEK
jgi:hypothetical protein